MSDQANPTAEHVAVGVQDATGQRMVIELVLPDGQRLVLAAIGSETNGGMTSVKVAAPPTNEAHLIEELQELAAHTASASALETSQFSTPGMFSEEVASGAFEGANTPVDEEEDFKLTDSELFRLSNTGSIESALPKADEPAPPSPPERPKRITRGGAAAKQFGAGDDELTDASMLEQATRGPHSLPPEIADMMNQATRGTPITGVPIPGAPEMNDPLIGASLDATTTGPRPADIASIDEELAQAAALAEQATTGPRMPPVPRDAPPVAPPKIPVAPSKTAFPPLAPKRSGAFPPLAPKKAGPAQSPHPQKLRRESQPSIPAVGSQSTRSAPRRPQVKRADVDVVGIDFGTSYSCVGFLGAGLELIPGGDGDVLIPSIVSFPRPGEIVIGEEAKQRMAGEAQWTITSPKRLIARPFKDPHVSVAVGQLAMRTFAGTDKFVRFEAHGSIYSVTDICSIIIRELQERASRYLNKTIKRAVFAVPVAYGSLQRTAIEQAARQAGLEVEAMLTEPSAALLAYGFRGKKGLAAVFDFGGGTFDFCVVDVTEAKFRVICAGGDPWLGGDDFDQVLADLVADSFLQQTQVDLRTRTVEWQQLIFACESAKRELSDKTHAQVVAPDLLMTGSGPVGIDMTVSRADFVRLSTQLIERSLQIAQSVMAQANIKPEQIDMVVMTGGTSMIPALRAGVTQLFKKQPLSGDADTAVVRGTALLAAEIDGTSTAKTAMAGRSLQEVSGRTIAVGVSGKLLTLFKQDTPLPAVVKATFRTTKDNQPDMAVALMEGTEKELSKRNMLGQLRYRGLKPAPAGQGKVDFVFKLDEAGVLHVAANVEGKVIERTIKVG